jgi:hypothetical protein
VSCHEPNIAPAKTQEHAPECPAQAVSRTQQSPRR